MLILFIYTYISKLRLPRDDYLHLEKEIATC